jgi:tetratricopeptide (TPR) repeat protein
VLGNFKRKRTEKLTAAGFACLNNEEYEKAIKIADQLEELRFSSSFEIAAQAYSGLGNLERAVSILERGVKLAPDVWGNWQLLGNYLSDLERFESAASSYRSALKCPKVRVGSIQLNQAILANRQNHFDEALQILEKIDDRDLLLPISETRISSLKGLNRIEEAISLANQILSELSDKDKHAELRDRVAATLGRLRLMSGEVKEVVRKWAIDSAKNDTRSRMLLALIRDIEAIFSKTANYYRLLIHGIIPITSPRYREAKGFYITYDVVADNVDEGLQFIREFEDDDVKGNLFIDEQDLMEFRPDDPKGVYRRNGYSFYEKDE